MVRVTSWVPRSGPSAGERAGAAGDEGAVLGAEAGGAVEGEGRLAAVEGDHGLGEQRRARRSGRRRGRVVAKTEVGAEPIRLARKSNQWTAKS